MMEGSLTYDQTSSQPTMTKFLTTKCHKKKENIFHLFLQTVEAKENACVNCTSPHQQRILPKAKKILKLKLYLEL